MTQQEFLLAQLRGMRRRIRTLFALDGIGRLMAAVPPAILAAILLDYLIKFPPLFRMAMLLGIIALAAIVVVRHLWRPMRTVFGAGDVAIELEGRFPELDDRLATTVNFLEKPDDRVGESDELREAVISETLDATIGMRFQKALKPRPLVLMFVLGLVVTAGIALLGAWQAEAAGIGMRRLLNPLTEEQWPKRTLLDVGSNRRFVIPIGDDFQATVQVDGVVPDRVFIRYRELGSSTFAPPEIMKPLANIADGNVFGRTFTRVRKSFEYYVTGGDDSTGDRGLVTVDARPRPRIENVLLTISPPAYISDGQVVTAEGQGSIRALQGSKIVLDIFTNKAIGVDADGRPQAELLFGKVGKAGHQRRQRFAFVGPETRLGDLTEAERLIDRMKADHRVLRSEFEAEETLPLNFQLVCQDGFDGQPGEDLYLVATEDEPPRVRIVEPTQSIMDVTFRSVVRVKAHVQDDCGVTRIALGWKRGTSQQKGTMGLEAVRPVERGTDARPLALSAVRRWDLRDIEPELNVGDELVYRCMAVDNFQWRGRGPHTSESQEYRLRVVSIESMAEAMRRRLMALGLRVGDLVKRQEDLQGETKDTRAAKKLAEPLSQKGREQTMGQEDAQRRLTRQADDIRSEFERLLNQFRLNRIPQDKAFEHAVEAQQALKDVARDPMPKAARALRDSRGAEATPQTQTQKLDRAVAEQQRAIDRLRESLGRLERFTEAEAIAQQLRQILRQQQKLTGKTGRLADQTLGKAQSELTQAERDAQQSTSSRQGELSRDLKKAIDQITESSKRLQQSDPAVSEALKETAQDAATRDPARKMRNAARQIGQNQAAAAGANQKSAEEDIRELIDKLEHRRQQELKSQIAQIKELQKELAKIRKKEEGHLQENRDFQAGKPRASKPEQQAPKQGETSKQTEQLSQRMEQAGSQQASQATQDAQQSMSQAQGQLSQSQSRQAEQKQEKSLEQLDQAKGELEQDLRETETELAEEQLEEIKQQLARIKDGEIEVNKSTAYLQKRRLAKTFARSDSEKLIFTTDHQKELLGETGQIVKELQEGGVKVFTFVLKIAADRMDESSQRLDKQQTDPITQAAQKKAIILLDKLCKALEEEISNRKKKDDGGGGQQGDGQQGPAELVPTLAELKMLRMMQVDIKSATSAVGEALKQADAPQAELKAHTKRIGRDQEKVKRLMQELTDPNAGRAGGEEL